MKAWTLALLASCCLAGCLAEGERTRGTDPAPTAPPAGFSLEGEGCTRLAADVPADAATAGALVPDDLDPLVAAGRALVRVAAWSCAAGGLQAGDAAVTLGPFHLATLGVRLEPEPATQPRTYVVAFATDEPSLALAFALAGAPLAPEAMASGAGSYGPADTTLYADVPAMPGLGRLTGFFTDAPGAVVPEDTLWLHDGTAGRLAVTQDAPQLATVANGLGTLVAPRGSALAGLAGEAAPNHVQWDLQERRLALQVTPAGATA